MEHAWNRRSKLSALHHVNHQCKLVQGFQESLALLSDELKDAYDVNNGQNKRCSATEVVSFEMCVDSNQPELAFIRRRRLLKRCQ